MPDLPPPPAFPESAQFDLAIALRHATAGAHARIERLPMLSRLMSPSVTREDYRDYLQAMAAIHGPLEPRLYAPLDAETLGLLGIQPKVPALRHDLEEQGGHWPDVSWDGAPPLDLPQGLGYALGGLYVLEGATLGGHTIARHLRRCLGNPLGAAGFLDFHGARTALAWRRFSAGLNAGVGRCGVTPETVIAGALTVFSHIYKRLEQAEPGRPDSTKG